MIASIGILLSTIGILFYILWYVKYRYWICQNVPQLQTFPILGSFLPTKKPLQELEMENYRKYGRIYGRYDGSTPVLSVAEPELLHYILNSKFSNFSERREMKFNDPVVDNTLFSLEGKDWKRVRKTAVCIFQSTYKLKQMIPSIENCIESLLHSIQAPKEAKKDNSTEGDSSTRKVYSLNVQRIVGAFVIDTIGKCVFGNEINSLSNENDPFVTKAKKLLECSYGWRTILIMVCPSVMKYLSISLLNPETTQFYREKILHEIEKRKFGVIQVKEGSKDPEDFLKFLMKYYFGNVELQDQNNNNIKEKCDEANCRADKSSKQNTSSDEATSSDSNHAASADDNHDAPTVDDNDTSSDGSYITSLDDNHAVSVDGYHTASTNNNNHNILSGNNPNNKELSLDELVAQCVTFFTAGYDATTSLLTHAMYNLAMHQDCQDKVVEEIETEIENQNGELNFEILKRLKFMKAVLDECLRLCPSMVRNERRVTSDCMLGNTNIKLKKGMLISIPIYAIHRDPEWYDEPDEFRPERFYESNEGRSQYVLTAFGHNNRRCVGFEFVLMQVKLCLVRILLKFRIQPSQSTPARIGYTEVRNVLKVNEVELSFVERQNSNGTTGGTSTNGTEAKTSTNATEGERSAKSTETETSANGIETGTGVNGIETETSANGTEAETNKNERSKDVTEGSCQSICSVN